MLLRSQIRTAIRLALAISVMPLHAQAQPENRTILQCVLQYAELVGLKKKRAELTEAAAVDANKVTPSLNTRLTKLYVLDDEKVRTPIEAVNNLRSIEGVQLMLSGTGFHEALQGELNGKHVFVKISTLSVVEKATRPRRSFSQLTNEVAWIKRLDALGIGPKFYGVTVKDGYRGVITDFIDGVQTSVLPEVDKVPADFIPNKKLVESLRNMQTVLEREGIFPDDLQIRMTRDQAFIVDPEYFQPASDVSLVRLAKTRMQQLIDDVESRLPKEPN